MRILERLARQPHYPGRITCDPRVHGSHGHRNTAGAKATGTSLYWSLLGDVDSRKDVRSVALRAMRCVTDRQTAARLCQAESSGILISTESMLAARRMILSVEIRIFLKSSAIWL